MPVLSRSRDDAHQTRSEMTGYADSGRTIKVLGTQRWASTHHKCATEVRSNAKADSDFEAYIVRTAPAEFGVVYF
jgi:hypothetical protein